MCEFNMPEIQNMKVYQFCGLETADYLADFEKDYK